MTGPEHYAEAEKLLFRIGNCTSDSPEDKALIASLAQVHASLALAAATIQAQDAYDSPLAQTAKDWTEALL